MNREDYQDYISRKNEITRMRMRGYKLQEIADAFNISRQRAQVIIGKTGWVHSWKTMVIQHPSTFDIRHLHFQLFWEKVNIKNKDECWEWQGKNDPAGYGRYSIGYYAHRLAWEYINGEIPISMFVCHHCDNPLCVNPLHLFLGTAKDNTDDMIKKGRAGFQKKKPALKSQ
jgi:hypothetical protein